MKKINKSIIMTLVILLYSLSSFASQFEVRGTLVDSIFNEGEPYVTIRIYSDDKKISKPIKIGITDENGNFSESLPTEGKYSINFTAIGRQEINKSFELTSLSPIANLGYIIIKDNEEMLQGIEVVARKPIIKAETDRLIYDLQEDPATKSSTIIEMLRKVPMVTVDGDNNIKVNGSSDFKIYINGRPDPTLSSNAKDILKSMPASSIKSIEVITEPGAKYDAEGVGGILNLITETKNSIDGFLANFSVSASNRDASGTIYARAKQNKVTISANYSNIKQFSAEHSNISNREIFNSEIEHFNRSEMSVLQNAQLHIGNLQLSYEADSLNLFTVSGDIVAVKGYGDISGYHEMSDIHRNLQWSYKSSINAKVNYVTASTTASYQHTFHRQGHNLVLSYMYNYGNTGRNMDNFYYEFYNHPYLPAYRNDVKTPSNEHTIQLDYSNPFTLNHKLETGAKYIIRRNKNYSNYYNESNGNYEFNEVNSVDMQQYQDIAALYASYTFNHGRFGANAGVRYEHTRMGVNFITEGYDNFSNYLNDIVPNAMISYRIGIAGMLRLNYNMRITRPNIESMNPFQDKTDPSNIQYGNPNLTSVKNNQVAVTLSDFSHKIGYTVSAKYNNTANMISSYTYMDNSIFYTTYDNIGSCSITSINAYATWSITPKIKLSINGAINYTDYKDKKMNISNSGWSGNIGGDFNYDMPWKLRLNAYGGYGTQSISLQGKGSSWNYYGLSLSRKFLEEDRLEISINANQFLTPHNKYVTITETTQFRSESIFKNSQWKIGLSISYRLGGLKQDVKKTSKSINNDDLEKSSSNGNIM